MQDRIIEDILNSFECGKPLSSKLPFNYRRIPSIVRTKIANSKSISGSNENLELDLDLVRKDFFIGGCSPLIVSHDLDTKESVDIFLNKFAPIELRLGIKPMVYIVPFAWKISAATMSELAAISEVGVHGFDHSGRTPFLKDTKLQNRLLKIVEFARDFHINSYRAPSLLRTTNFLNALSKFFKFDSSIPTFNGPLPHSSLGCKYTLPFKINQMLEVPITLPRDGSLIFQKIDWPDIYENWITQSRKLSDCGQIIQSLTHPENRFTGNTQGLYYFEKFLNEVMSIERVALTTNSELVNLFSSNNALQINL